MSLENKNEVKEERPVKNILPLSYALSLISQLLPIPVHVFTDEDKYLDKFNIEDKGDNSNIFETDLDLRKEYLKEIRSKKVVLFTSEKPILFGGVECTDGLTLILGPIAISDVDQSFCKLYALKHSASNIYPLRCSEKKLAALLLLIYSSITNKYVYLNDFLDESFMSQELIEQTYIKFGNIISNNTIGNKPHNPVVFEETIRRSIKNGDEDALKRALNSVYGNMRGTLAHNELRSAKNLAIVDVTIATRAAIEAGLSVEKLYTLSDAFIMEIEECKFPADAYALARACALRCTQMVSSFIKHIKNKENSSLIVAKACEYIERHVYSKFNVEDLCKKLKVSKSYLSKQFKNEKKVTLGEYYRQRKIEVAKILLTSSDKSMYEIATLLNFNSQSHFGRVFLECSGWTPTHYRNNFSIRDSVL